MYSQVYNSNMINISSCMYIFYIEDFGTLEYM